MDIKVPIIADRDGAWKYKVGDTYSTLDTIRSSFTKYKDPSEVKDAIDAFKNTRMTGELPEVTAERLIEQATKQLDQYVKPIAYSTRKPQNAIIDPTPKAPNNELDVEYCDLLGDIVARFLAYADTSLSVGAITPEQLENDSEYYGSLFSSDNYNAIGNVSTEIFDFYCNSQTQRVSKAAERIYPVTDSLRDYIQGFVSKPDIKLKIDNLNELVKSGAIRITPNVSERT